ncbi:MAG: hypothetical protein QM303_02470 [Bacillota bacterium]|jgi:hypothetical protein|nr:hypothetical protein [Bacillota bacterium]
MYELTKSGKGIKKGRYHKGIIIGKLDNYLLTECKDRPNAHSAKYQLFQQTEQGVVKLDLTRRENRVIKTKILEAIS